ncbi:MAG: SDR family oxidoreductase [Bacteroidetes bacterium]|nr:MAG: SDR family oxidoreductase [Bacteroidota bacterium]
MFSQNLFQDQVVLVTGGRSGIGYAIAEQFLRHGARVFIASRKAEPLAEAAEKLAALGPCSGIPCDIREPEQVKALAAAIKAEAGRLDILVNNAGGQFPSPAEYISDKGWLAVINNNLNGTWFMTRTMAEVFFLPQKSGSVVNVIANVYRGFPGMAHTGAARAGVDNLTKSLAVEWSRKGIRINSVAPGFIQSSGLDQYPPHLLQGLADHIPMQRLGTVEEVAGPVLFLASPMASYITGETLYVDGANRLWGSPFPL